MHIIINRFDDSKVAEIEAVEQRQALEKNKSKLKRSNKSVSLLKNRESGDRSSSSSSSSSSDGEFDNGSGLVDHSIEFETSLEVTNLPAPKVEVFCHSGGIQELVRRFMLCRSYIQTHTIHIHTIHTRILTYTYTYIHIYIPYTHTHNSIYTLIYMCNMICLG